jgi:hypothetical protein
VAVDPIRNPYEPGAGTPPRSLVGRERLLDAFQIALERCLAGRSFKSFLATGLRGVGKTVLLNQFEQDADARRFHTAFIEASDDGTFVPVLCSNVRRIILALDRAGALSEAAKRAIRVFKSFTLRLNDKGVEIAFDVDPERGVADSGDLATDVMDLFVALGAAAKDRHTGVVFAVDELQYLRESELAALIVAIHRTTQRQLPILLVGAGLPSLPGLAGEAKSYAERLFDFPIVDRLSPEDATRAVIEPAADEGVSFTPEATQRVVEVTRGYPYFIQVWGYHVWNQAGVSPISLDDVQHAGVAAVSHLDESFFRVRFDRLTPKEKRYLRAMAELGPGPSRSGEIATVYRAKVASVAPIRNGLIHKGMIYAPAYGDTAFTVPLFDEFMRRTVPELDLEPDQALSRHVM